MARWRTLWMGLLLGIGCGPAPAPGDAEVIEQLRRAGSNLEKAHPVEFFLYFPSRAAAEQACKTLQSRGFLILVEPAAGPSQFLCKADKELVPTIDALGQLRTELDALAEQLGGEYDGWGTSAVP